MKTSFKGKKWSKYEALSVSIRTGYWRAYDHGDDDGGRAKDYVSGIAKT